MSAFAASGPSGTATNALKIDRGTSARTQTPRPGPICRVYHEHAALQWSAPCVKWTALPPGLGAAPDALRKYKDLWVATHKHAIVRLSRHYRLPELLLAGIAWIEVGGEPDIEGFAYRPGKGGRAGGPLPQAAAVAKPGLKPVGDVSIQVRQAAEALGQQFDKLSESQREHILSCLYDDAGNLPIVARHLAQIAAVIFRGTILLGSDEISIVASRYHRGPNVTLEALRHDTSYGDLILGRRRQLLKLLK